MIELHNDDCMKVFPTIPDGSVEKRLEQKEQMSIFDLMKE